MKKIIVVMVMSLAMLLIVAFTCYGIDACYQKNDGQLRILTHNKDCDKDCDKGHNKDCDKDHNKDCDKDGYTNKCKPSEIPISWNQIGPPGPQGPKGDPGAPGAPGKDGKTILSGTVEPPADGKEGDLYLNTDTKTLFGPKTSSGEWPLIGTIARTCAAQIDCGTTPCTYKNETCEITEFNILGTGRYKITFKDKFIYPVCVLYVYPRSDFSPITFAEYTVGGAGEITFYTFYGWMDEYHKDYKDMSFNFICTEP